MAKDNDLKNIFESYYNNVILNEAVRSIEVDENGNQIPSGTGKMPSAETLNATRERLKQQRAQEIINQRNSMVKQGIPMGSNVYTTPNGSVSTQPVANQTTQPVVNVVKQSAQQANQEGAEETAQQMNQDVDNGESEVVSQEVIGSRPALTATNGTENFDGTTVTSGPVVASDEEFEQNEEEDADGWTEVGEPEVENVTDEYETEETPAQHVSVKLEKNNISKFLKHLSEKNYSSAHKYLKAILEYKIKNNISKRIK